MTDFTIEVAKELISSDNQFPVDFDKAWTWLEYSTKANAKKSFEKAGFLIGTDFRSFMKNDKREIGATQREIIELTIDCFKTWAMLANTDKGKQIRFN